jgi:hypothetical protein
MAAHCALRNSLQICCEVGTAANKTVGGQSRTAVTRRIRRPDLVQLRGKVRARQQGIRVESGLRRVIHVVGAACRP